MPLGEDGLGLSGGQKQIIALARLTLRNPRVVLLDEPTTGLDQLTEKRALSALHQWCKNKTLLVVTHRTQVLSIVSRIIVIDQGKIVMDGPRDVVLQQLAQNEQAEQQRAQHAAKTANPPQSGRRTVVVKPEGVTVEPADAAEATVMNMPHQA